MYHHFSRSLSSLLSVSFVLVLIVVVEQGFAQNQPPHQNVFVFLCIVWVYECVLFPFVSIEKWHEKRKKENKQEWKPMLRRSSNSLALLFKPISFMWFWSLIYWNQYTHKYQSKTRSPAKRTNHDEFTFECIRVLCTFYSTHFGPNTYIYKYNFVCGQNRPKQEKKQIKSK